MNTGNTYVDSVARRMAENPSDCEVEIGPKTLVVRWANRIAGTSVAIAVGVNRVVLQIDYLDAKAVKPSWVFADNNPAFYKYMKDLAASIQDQQ